MSSEARPLIRAAAVADVPRRGERAVREKGREARVLDADVTQPFRF